MATAATEDEEYSSQDIASKLARYEDLVNNRIKRDLEEAEEQRQRILEEISEYRRLLSNLEFFQEHNLKSFNTMVDLGFNFQMQAKVPSTQHVYVHVGQQFYPQLTLDEAKEFIGKKLVLLDKSAARSTQRVSEIKAYYTLILNAMAEIIHLRSHSEAS
ncbi:uncharacterized protein VTP21DRAFT_7984 [Calcarisporiella thermophila]|uniref:uncharacterized protein n=1 Tax=Calcarisporiella thermophila TaxID=911321 RepID=UPI0037445D61